jgi:hypothetical protein
MPDKYLFIYLIAYFFFDFDFIIYTKMEGQQPEEPTTTTTQQPVPPPPSWVQLS